MWPEPSPTPLPKEVWIRHLECFLETGQLNPEILPYLDSKQRFCINEIKKYFQRLKRKNNRSVL